MFISFGLPSLPFPNSFVPSVLSLPLFYYLVYRYDVFLCNEESKNSIEDWLNLTCFRTFTALHWKREVSKKQFHFFSERVIDDLSSTDVPYLFDEPPWALIKFFDLESGR